MLALALLLPSLSVLAADPAPPTLGRLSLARALEIAAQRNPDISLAEIAVRAADAALLSADVTPNPTLTLGIQNYNPRAGVGPGSLRDKQVDTAVRLEQLIERGGKRQYRAENATQLLDASRADLANAQRQLRSNVADMYYNALAAQERLSIAQDTAKLFGATLAAADQRRAAGDLAGADVDRLRVDALRAKNDVRQAEADTKRSRLALLLMLGVSAAPEQVEAADEWPVPVAPGNLPSFESMLDQRPDIRAANARLQAAQANLRLAQSQRTRDVSVGVQVDHSPASPLNGFYGSNTFGVSVQVPLFVNHYYEGDIRNALAGVDSAQANLLKARREASASLQRAFSDMQSAQERLGRFRDELTVAARRAADAAEFAFRNGATGVTDVLDARRTYRAITLDELNARADYARALAAWRAATLDETTK